MRYFASLIIILTLLTTPLYADAPKVKQSSQYINYAQAITAWTTYNLVSNDYSYKIVSILRYKDGYDKGIYKTRALVVIEHDDLILSYYLFISPMRGVERSTFLGSSLFSQPYEYTPSTIEDIEAET